MSNQHKTIINAILVNGSWLAMIFSNNNLALIISVCVVVIVLHLALIRQRRLELAFLTIATIWGIILEALLYWSGAVSYSTTIGIPWFMLGLWITFSTSFYYWLSWTSQKPLLAAVIGPFAAVAYATGERLSGMITIHSLIAVAGLWAITLPLLGWLKTNMKAWQ